MLWVASVGGRIPERFPTDGLAEVEGAKVTNGICPIFTPTHSATLQSVAYDRLAGRFHRARTNLPAVADVGWVVHAVLVIAKVLHHSAMLFPKHRRGCGKVQFLQTSSHRRAAFVFQSLAHIVQPRLSRRLVFAIQRLAQFHEIFLGMKEVKNANGLGKEPLEKWLQTRSSVADRDVLIGVGSADLQGLVMKLPSEVVELEKAR
jgi:hypothetical protein